MAVSATGAVLVGLYLLTFTLESSVQRYSRIGIVLVALSNLAIHLHYAARDRARALRLKELDKQIRSLERELREARPSPSD